MGDPLDISLEDSELAAEVELVASLIVAASASDGPLPQDEIDRILGVEPAPESSAAPSAPPERADDPLVEPG